jgi:hypothetical protein
MAETVTHYCLNLSVAAFIVFAIVTAVGLVVSLIAAVRGAAAPTIHGQDIGGNVDNLTRLLDAVSKVTDSFAKAGPGIAALVASILFVAVAAYCLPRENPKNSPTVQTDAKTPSPK